MIKRLHRPNELSVPLTVGISMTRISTPSAQERKDTAATGDTFSSLTAPTGSDSRIFSKSRIAALAGLTLIGATAIERAVKSDLGARHTAIWGTVEDPNYTVRPELSVTPPQTYREALEESSNIVRRLEARSAELQAAVVEALRSAIGH